MRRTVAIIACAVLLTAAGGAPPGLQWERSTEIAAGGGQKGPWRQNESRYDYVDDATLAFGASGLLVAWVDQARKDVMVRPVPTVAGAPVNVSRSPATFSWQPRIAVPQDQSGRVYLLWQEIIFSGGSHGGDILFARSGDGGAGFDAPLNLSRSRGGDGKGRLSRTVWSNGSHDLAVAGDGGIVAAWTEYDGALWLARSRDGGASFTAPRQVAGSAARPARAPALAAGPGARLYLAWTVGEDPAAGIHVAQSSDGGASFGPALRISPGPRRADAPRLAVDGEGAVHLAYAETGPDGRRQVRHTRSPDGIVRFAAPRTVSARDGQDAAYPAIALDGRGRVVVAWEVLEPGAARPHALAMTVSRDGGRRFSAPSLVPGSSAGAGAANGSHQGLLGKKLALDAAGRIAIVNSTMQPGERSRVWLMRGRLRP
ncbi:sialidase family protein [Massilia sp. SYSU DXS3249]